MILKVYQDTADIHTNLGIIRTDMEIHITDDFNLDRIANSGQCFRWRKDDSGAYRIIHKGHCLKIRPLGNGMFRLSCSEDEYRRVWHDYFDFGENYRSVRERVSREEDPFLADACEYGKGIRILRQDPWEMLVSFIISQNKNIPAIKKSIELLCETAGKRCENTEQEREDDGQLVFPSPEQILSLSDEALAACRLGYRCRYVKAAASDVAEGKLDLDSLRDAPEEETIKGLMSVCGVGVKVANCISLFGLHHIDAFPIDVWIRRILDNEYPSGYPKERYSPYNGIYQQYMFYYYRNFITGISARPERENVCEQERCKAAVSGKDVKRF